MAEGEKRPIVIGDRNIADEAKKVHASLRDFPPLLVASMCDGIVLATLAAPHDRPLIMKITGHLGFGGAGLPPHIDGVARRIGNSAIPDYHTDTSPGDVTAYSLARYSSFHMMAHLEDYFATTQKAITVFTELGETQADDQIVIAYPDGKIHRQQAGFAIVPDPPMPKRDPKAGRERLSDPFVYNASETMEEAIARFVAIAKRWRTTPGLKDDESAERAGRTVLQVGRFDRMHRAGRTDDEMRYAEFFSYAEQPLEDKERKGA